MLLPYSAACNRFIFGIIIIFIFICTGDAFKAFKDAGDPENMLEKADKCKKLAAHIKRAEVSRKLLHKECELSGHLPNAIPVANETRWDSAFTNMKGVLYHKPCLLRLAQKGHLRMEDSEGRIVDLIPSFNDFLVIEASKAARSQPRFLRWRRHQP